MSSQLQESCASDFVLCVRGREEEVVWGGAVRRHGRDARMAGSGLGVDRHLLGESLRLSISWVEASVDTDAQP